MRSVYQQRLGPGLIAKVELSPAGVSRKGDPRWNIDWLTVPPEARGSGIGRVLMDAVLSDADEEGVVLTLEARSCLRRDDRNGLDQLRLVEWYQGLGFVLNGRRGEFGPIMVRSRKGISQ